MFCLFQTLLYLKIEICFVDGSNEPSLYLYTVSFSLVTSGSLIGKEPSLFSSFSSFDVSISLLRYMLLLKELYRLASRFSFLYRSIIAMVDFHFCFPFDWECKGNHLFEFCKKYFVLFFEWLSVKNRALMLCLPLFQFLPLIAIGSAKVEVFLFFPKFI